MLVKSRSHPAGMGGTQDLYRFENGYGASVIKGSLGSYGGYELAVLVWDGEGEEDFHLTYDTPVTDDVEGYLDDAKAAELLAEIEALPNCSLEEIQDD